MGLSREPLYPTFHQFHCFLAAWFLQSGWVDLLCFVSLGLWSDLCCDVQCIMIRFYFSDEYLGLGFMSCCFLLGFSSQQITSVIFFKSSVCVYLIHIAGYNCWSPFNVPKRNNAPLCQLSGIVTVTTVGYGDITPKSWPAKVVSGCLCFISVPGSLERIRG